MELRRIDTNAYMLGYGWGRLVGTTQSEWFRDGGASPGEYFDLVRNAAEEVSESGELENVRQMTENAKYVWDMRVGQKSQVEDQILYRAIHRMRPLIDDDAILALLTEETAREMVPSDEKTDGLAESIVNRIEGAREDSEQSRRPTWHRFLRVAVEETTAHADVNERRFRHRLHCVTKLAFCDIMKDRLGVRYMERLQEAKQRKRRGDFVPDYYRKSLFKRIPGGNLLKRAGGHLVEWATDRGGNRTEITEDLFFLGVQLAFVIDQPWLVDDLVELSDRLFGKCARGSRDAYGMATPVFAGDMRRTVGSAAMIIRDLSMPASIPDPSDVGDNQSWAAQVHSVLSDGVALCPEKSDKEDSSSAGEEETQGEVGDDKYARPDRCWTYNYCPNCSIEGTLEWLSFTEFANRCSEKGVSPKNRGTVSSRVQKGRYWANADKHVPWCENCEEKTPDGAGREQPVEKPERMGFDASNQQIKDIMAWSENVIQNAWPSFSKESEGKDDRYESDEASEAYQIAVGMCIEKMKKRDERLGRDQVKELAQEVVKDVRKEQQNRKYSRSVNLENLDDDNIDCMIS